MTHKTVHHVPFDDQPDPVEVHLREQIGRLHDERRDLCTAISLLHRATANLQSENDRLRAENDRLRRMGRRHWWQR